MNKLRHLCSFLLITLMQGLAVPAGLAQAAPVQEENLLINVNAPSKPFPHKWEYMIKYFQTILGGGSKTRIGSAPVWLRSSYPDCLGSNRQAGLPYKGT